METKLFSVFLLTILVITGIAIAATNFSVSPQTATFTQSVDSRDITVDNSAGTLPLSYPLTVSILDKDDVTVVFDVSGSGTVGIGATETLTITAPSDLDYSRFDLGNIYSEDLEIDDGTDTETVTISVEKSFCEFGNVGEDIVIKDIDDKTSGDDWEWNPLDDVEIRVKIKNDGEEKEKISVMLSLYDTVNDEFIEIGDDDEDELEETARIDDGEKETFNFNFKIPGDVEEGEYTLYVKAYLDNDEDLQCISETESIDIEIDDELAIDEIEIPETLPCDFMETISFKLYNFDIGDDEQFRVKIYNKELGISEYSEEFELDEGDYERVYFDIEIPEDAEEKIYRIDVIVEYDYSDNSDIYKSAENIDYLTLKVEGDNCIRPVTKDVSITASLESDAKAGEEVIIRAVIENEGQDETEYTVLVTGNDAWSVLQSIAPQTVTLDAGDSKDVLITLKANADAEGEKIFNIKVLYDGQTKEQPVALTIEESGLGITGSVIGDSFRDNWFIWVIALINIILIIAIILVSIRISRS